VEGKSTPAIRVMLLRSRRLYTNINTLDSSIKAEEEDIQKIESRWECDVVQLFYFCSLDVTSLKLQGKMTKKKKKKKMKRVKNTHMETVFSGITSSGYLVRSESLRWKFCKVLGSERPSNVDS
jgi:hypothetical protein